MSVLPFFFLFGGFLDFGLFVLKFSVLVRGKVFFAAAEDDLERGEVTGCVVGRVEPVSQSGWKVVAI
jgi:hypothetical protein